MVVVDVRTTNLSEVFVVNNHLRVGTGGHSGVEDHVVIEDEFVNTIVTVRSVARQLIVVVNHTLSGLRAHVRIAGHIGGKLPNVGRHRHVSVGNHSSHVSGARGSHGHQ